MNVDEPISLSEYDPAWPARFEAEKQAILHSEPNGFRAIEHFGSTAVPGLLSKPILDILIGADVIPPGDAQVQARDLHP